MTGTVIGGRLDSMVGAWSTFDTPTVVTSAVKVTPNGDVGHDLRQDTFALLHRGPLGQRTDGEGYVWRTRV